jgi:hypothetical protein
MAANFVARYVHLNNITAPEIVRAAAAVALLEENIISNLEKSKS